MPDVSLSDTLRSYGSSGLQPDPRAPWHRRVTFYALRTLFEGPTITMSGLMFLHSLFWAAGAANPEWPIDIILSEGLSRLVSPVAYAAIFLALTGYQLLCHTVLNCGPYWRTTVASLTLFVTAQTAVIPVMSFSTVPSLVMAGNYTVCVIAFLVLSRSFPTWTTREHYYGRR